MTKTNAQRQADHRNRRNETTRKLQEQIADLEMKLRVHGEAHEKEAQSLARKFVMARRAVRLAWHYMQSPDSYSEDEKRYLFNQLDEIGPD